MGEAARVRSVGHGRVETRTIRVVDLDGSTDGHGDFFPGARQVIKIVRRRRGRDGRWSVQTVYAITSLDHRAADPALLATWVRGHWSIEVRLHWVRDTAFAEDHSQVRTASGPQNLAALRTLAINALRLTGHTNVPAGLRKTRPYAAPAADHPRHHVTTLPTPCYAEPLRTRRSRPHNSRLPMSAMTTMTTMTANMRGS